LNFFRGLHEVEVLTYHSIGVQRFVVEAENGSQIVEVGVLRNEVPLRVVHSVIEVCHRDLYPPVLLVVNLHWTRGAKLFLLGSFTTEAR
jgi:hypothetical protein